MGKRQGGASYRGGKRQLIAGLRVTAADLELLGVVRPFMAECDTESDLAYRLWRRGLEITLAELVGSGAALPDGGMDQRQLAVVVGQRLQLCLPLLERAGLLSTLRASQQVTDEHVALVVGEQEEIEVAPEAEGFITAMGGDTFL